MNGSEKKSRHNYAWFKGIVAAMGLQLQERTRVADKIVIWAGGETCKHPNFLEDADGLPLMAIFAFGPDEDHLEMAGTAYFPVFSKAGEVMTRTTVDDMRKKCADGAQDLLGRRTGQDNG
jgi:hypothetical protein|tara:strand:- start:940 stop:1299 length:360 start_codon:yes stop_codon:yes gene_type:complete